MTERVSLLPSTHTPEVIRQLLEFAPDTVCLTDELACAIELPRFLYPRELAGTPGAWWVPQVPDSQLAAIVFTSGSTGTPLPYRKTWGRLARCVRDGAPRLGLVDGRRHALVGTVPAQHMYGFESTVLLALLSGNAFSAERPFYPGRRQCDGRCRAAAPHLDHHARASADAARGRGGAAARGTDRFGHGPPRSRPGTCRGSRVSSALAGDLRLHRNRPDRHPPHGAVPKLASLAGSSADGAGPRGVRAGVDTSNSAA